MTTLVQKWNDPLVIIGLGAVGRALAAAMAGITSCPLILVGRNRIKDRLFARKLKAKLVKDLSHVDINKGIIIIAVQDKQIRQTAKELSKNSLSWSKIAVFHVSGPLGTDVLAPLHKLGARTAAWHPYQTFPPNATTPPLRGVTFGITGDLRGRKAATRLTRSLGGNPLTLCEEDRVLYHASAVFACGFVATQLQMATQLLRNTGISEKRALQAILPISRQTLQNVEYLGADNSLTGPATRGDHKLIRAHLAALKKVSPEFASVYRELTKRILREREK